MRKGFKYFRYEKLTPPRCQVEVHIPGVLHETDCGEVATHRVWWLGKESHDLYLCEEHFNEVYENEYDEGD